MTRDLTDEQSQRIPLNDTKQQVKAMPTYYLIDYENVHDAGLWGPTGWTVLLSGQPRAAFHTLLWKRFGQKLGTRYYRVTVNIAGEYMYR